MTTLTRKDFYEIAELCRDEALDLARYDQNRVNVAHCQRFNRWLRELKQYDRLENTLADLAPARPITRWHVIGVSLILWFALNFFLAPRLGTAGSQLTNLGAVVIVVILLIMPESIYGTTVELLEGKVLRVVETLEELLYSGEMEFTEAAFFQVKENLRAAREELRQQIDLAHRP
jgi:hypothetical protein